MNLQGKVVLITAAPSGIGEAASKAIARRGATVLLVARSRDRLEKIASTIEADGGSARAFTADLADPDSVARGVSSAVLEPAGLSRSAGAETGSVTFI